MTAQATSSPRPLTAVIIHYGALDSTLAVLRQLASPQLRRVLVNNGPQSSEQVELACPDDVTVLGSGENLGYSRAANLGIEHAVESGSPDVVILPNDGDYPAGCLASLQGSALEQGAAVAGPLVLYRDSETVWADGISVSLSTGIARNVGKGTRRVPPRGPRPVQLLPGHALLLVGCDQRPWLRFPPELFMYYEDVDLCLEARERGERVILDDRICVYHDKPGGKSYRFRAAQQRHMARSGILLWKRRVRGWRRLSYLLGFTALTLYRLSRSADFSALVAGLRGLGEGLFTRTLTAPRRSTRAV